MAYEPQPGTIAHRACLWLRSMDKVRPGYEPSTVEVCEGLDIDTYGFVPCMRAAREAGIVHTRKAKLGMGRVMLWRLGDGTPDPTLLPAVFVPVPDEPEKPLPEWRAPRFHPVAFGDQVLVKGVKIINGVAVFTPQQIAQLAQVCLA